MDRHAQRTNLLVGKQEGRNGLDAVIAGAVRQSFFLHTCDERKKVVLVELFQVGLGANLAPLVQRALLALSRVTLGTGERRGGTWL